MHGRLTLYTYIFIHRKFEYIMSTFSLSIVDKCETMILSRISPLEISLNYIPRTYFLLIHRNCPEIAPWLGYMQNIYERIKSNYASYFTSALRIRNSMSWHSSQGFIEAPRKLIVNYSQSIIVAKVDACLMNLIIIDKKKLRGLIEKIVIKGELLWS